VGKLGKEKKRNADHGGNNEDIYIVILPK